jgi:hypothetical protein
MMAASPATIRQAGGQRIASAMASSPLLLALAIISLVTAVRLTGTVDSDVAWQLWIGQRMLGGARLYQDIVETNPPLWFWMALPVDGIASMLHMRPEAVLIIGMGVLGALALCATERLIRHIGPRRRTFLLAYGSVTLLALPWLHTGQREQIVLTAAVPYAALVAARREGRAVTLPLAVLVGIGGGLGFGLKHYFLIVPTMLELWLFVGRRAGWRPFRPETIALVAVGAGYAVALLLWDLRFLTDIVPLILIAYGPYGAPSFQSLFGLPVIVGLIILAVSVLHSRLLTRAPFASALTICAVGFGLAYFIQFKGWPYHAIPLLGCASLALGALLAEGDALPEPLRFMAPGLLMLPFALTAREEMRPRLPDRDVLGSVAGLRSGDSVGFLSIETAIPWSVTLQGRYRYASRYNGFWMSEAILQNERSRSPDPRLVQLGHQIVAQTVDDFLCIPPKRIIVVRPLSRNYGPDILPLFLRDPRFAAVLSHYRVISRTSLETYQLASSLPPATATCRRGV